MVNVKLFFAPLSYAAYLFGTGSQSPTATNGDVEQLTKGMSDLNDHMMKASEYLTTITHDNIDETGSVSILTRSTYKY